jgi:hypothetical protein
MFPREPLRLLQRLLRFHGQLVELHDNQFPRRAPFVKAITTDDVDSTGF